MKMSGTAFTFISEVQTIAPAFTMGLWGLSVKKQELSEHDAQDSSVNIQSRVLDAWALCI